MIATSMLLAMAAIFTFACLMESRWPALRYVRAFAEAAMIGGCADWFAVTALFRRPFGLPVPHTAIIPRNKDKIGDALGGFIAENFLTEAVLESRLHQIEVAQWGAAWVQKAGHAEALARSITAWVRQLLLALPDGAVRQTVNSLGVSALRQLPASATAAKLLQLIWESGRADRWLELSLRSLSRLVSSHKALILDQVHAQSSRWIPGWVDRLLARKITAGVIQLLLDTKDPAHPLRIALDRAMADLLERLQTDDDLIAHLETTKASLLGDEAVGAALDRVWSDIEGWLDLQLDPQHDTLTPVVERGLRLWAEWLQSDQAIQAVFNTTARGLIKNTVAPQREAIGRIIAGIVSGWEARAVVEKLEQQLGPDLQYIRINGALVGGLVGLLIYSISDLMGLHHSW